MADSFRGWVVRDEDDQLAVADGVVVIDLHALADYGDDDALAHARGIVDVIGAMPYAEVASNWDLKRAHDKALEIISDLERAT